LMFCETHQAADQTTNGAGKKKIGHYHNGTMG
jgi:hypothetical protein